MPCTFYITDVNGTYTATYIPAYTFWALSVGVCAASNANCAACPGGTNSCTGAPTSAQPYYTYLIFCGSTPGHMSIGRYWYELNCSGTYYYARCACAIAGGQADSLAANVAVSCASLIWSGTLTPSGGNHLADPVGGTVSFHP
jgi:hypothetical protein